MLFLASQSPRRRDLLVQLGLEFEVLDVDVPERREPGDGLEDDDVLVHRGHEDRRRTPEQHGHEGVPEKNGRRRAPPPAGFSRPGCGSE